MRACARLLMSSLVHAKWVNSSTYKRGGRGERGCVPGLERQAAPRAPQRGAWASQGESLPVIPSPPLPAPTLASSAFLPSLRLMTYSTALTSWLVVRSTSLTSAASSTLKLEDSSSSSASASLLNLGFGEGA